jgi:hypothetical protein
VQWIKRVLLDVVLVCIMHDLMVEKETYINGTQYIRSRVYRNKNGNP